MKIEKYMYPDPFATSITAMVTGVNGPQPRQAIALKPQTRVIEDDAYVITFSTPSRIAGKIYDKKGIIKNVYL